MPPRMHREIGTLHILPPPAPIMGKVPLKHRLLTHTGLAFNPTLTQPSLDLTPVQIVLTCGLTTVQPLLPKAPRAMSILSQKEEEQKVVERKGTAPVLLAQAGGRCRNMLLRDTVTADTTDILWESSRNLSCPCETQALLVLLHLPEMMRQQDDKNTMHPPIQILTGSTTNRSAGVHVRHKATEATAGLSSAMTAAGSWDFPCEKVSLQGRESRLGQTWIRLERGQGPPQEGEVGGEE